MAHNDPHTGGSLTDMAPTGTTMPNDAGLQNTIPSLPRPDQMAENHQFDNEGIAEPDYVSAADNPRDLPWSTRDLGLSGEVITGTGDTLPAVVEAKRIDVASNDPGAKGQARTYKNLVKNRGVYDTFVGQEDEEAAMRIGEHEVRNEWGE